MPDEEELHAPDVEPDSQSGAPHAFSAQTVRQKLLTHGASSFIPQPIGFVAKEKELPTKKTLDNKSRDDLPNDCLKIEFPELKLSAEFQRHAAEHQWAERKTLGYSYHCSIYSFLLDGYSKWIAADEGEFERNAQSSPAGPKRMTMADLREVDAGAYKALRNKVYRDKETPPNTFFVPSLFDARLLAIADRREREALSRFRAHRTEANRKYMPQASLLER